MDLHSPPCLEQLRALRWMQRLLGLQLVRPAPQQLLENGCSPPVPLLDLMVRWAAEQLAECQQLRAALRNRLPQAALQELQVQLQAVPHPSPRELTLSQGLILPEPLPQQDLQQPQRGERQPLPK